MNEQLKRRGFAHNKILATVAICALFLSGSPVMTYAAEAPAVQEVQQTTLSQQACQDRPHRRPSRTRQNQR